MCQESESNVGIKVQNIQQLHLLTPEDNEGITGRYVVLEPSWALIQLFETLGHTTEVSISKTCTFSPVLTASKNQKIGLKNVSETRVPKGKEVHLELLLLLPFPLPSCLGTNPVFVVGILYSDL